MIKKLGLIACIFGFCAIILGAFGSHGLKNIVDKYHLEIWQKGVEYQFYHTLAILFLSINTHISTRFKNISFYCFCIGMIFFSGSLYFLSLNQFLNFPINSYLGPITPIGGVILMLGWLFMFLGILKNN